MELEGLIILCCDDDWHILDVFRRFLRDEGALCLCADSIAGLRRLLLAAANGDARIDAIVTDLYLLNGNGLNEIRLLRGRSAGIGLVLCSGQEDPGEEESVFLEKPFTRTELVSAILRSLGRQSVTP